MGSKRRRAAVDEVAQTPVNATANGPTAKKQKQSKAAAAAVTAAKPAAGHASPAKAAAPAVASESAPATKKKKPKKKNAKSSGADTPAAAKPAPTAAAAKSKGSEIDDLFASLKTKKREQAEAEAQQQRAAKKALAKERQTKKLLAEQIKLLEAQNTNSTATTGANPEARPVRYDEDGLPIYTEESLKINQGGDTADCPFDCWCCF